MKTPEEYRFQEEGNRFHSTAEDGNNGCFVIPSQVPGRTLTVIASDGLGWEHVSVSAHDTSKLRTPTWNEMCQIKDMFWDDEECVIQYHPPKSEYVNNHENTLHLWRPTKGKVAVPPSILVGIK
jgi:hypothetical protein